jgi:hypothetical protein
MLTNSQADAIAYIREYARRRKENALSVIDNVLRMSNAPQSDFDALIEKTKSKARVAIQFHPDRLDPHLKSVAEALLDGGTYKSQFETLLSSGSVSAHPGGARDLWEKHLFGGAYQQAGVENSHRPKYGALDLLGHSDGPSARFGSCYFLLKPAVTKRCTFTYLDSHLDPKEKGTHDEFDDIMAALLSDSFTDDVVLGERLRPTQLIEKMTSSIEKTFEERLSSPHRRVSDHYIEAQIHGSISLAEDVDYLVADPSFKGTATGEHLLAICKTYHIALSWHAGFVLPTSEVPTSYRGPTMPSLAQRVAPDGLLNVMKIGQAAASLKRDPHLWADRGSEKDVLQELKLLWHVLHRFG